MHETGFEEANDEVRQDKRAALSYLAEAFAEAKRDGIESDCLAQAALFYAFKELVSTYTEEPVAVFAESLPDKIRSGAYSVRSKH
jgi:hypothetical protein